MTILLGIAETLIMHEARRTQERRKQYPFFLLFSVSSLSAPQRFRVYKATINVRCTPALALAGVEAMYMV